MRCQGKNTIKSEQALKVSNEFYSNKTFEACPLSTLTSNKSGSPNTYATHTTAVIHLVHTI